MKKPTKSGLFSVLTLFAVLLSSLVPAIAQPHAAPASTQTDIHGPVGSNEFGESVYTLPNGNFVVVDPAYDPGGLLRTGAVYLYNGSTLALISVLAGNRDQDHVGMNGIVVLSNGNFVVNSPDWSSATVYHGGAVTWCSATTGCNGPISASNSLIGSHSWDQVGLKVTALSNGNYVVGSQFWDNGGFGDAGAATWGDGTKGITGTVSTSNSLVGSHGNDRVSYSGITALSNGNYVVASMLWDNGITDVGAATWRDGTYAMTGTVSAGNSLVGSHASDYVGESVTTLSNGNYVVLSWHWNNGNPPNMGAATWMDGTRPMTGTVSASNSLVDAGGHSSFVTALSNGNYVVSAPLWSNGSAQYIGAVTWGDGAAGISGTVSTQNSLVGSHIFDQVGTSVTALTNGNYVVGSPTWDSEFSDVGAATWGNGTTGITGTISSSNSLVGSHADDQVSGSITPALLNGIYGVRSPSWDSGSAAEVSAVPWFNGVIALSNGNYVVRSSNWDNGSVTNAGAATWGNGTTGITGPVSPSNSLVGSQSGGQVGYSLAALSNGNYVVGSPFWANGSVLMAGAATWGNGFSGLKGSISANNSLVGSQARDAVGVGITALTNGNYVVSSWVWNNGAITQTGAATWMNGAGIYTGTVSSTNSLVGSQQGDMVGVNVVALSNGNYLVISRNWDNGATVDAGAISLGFGWGRVPVGPVNSSNSVLGGASLGGSKMNYAFFAPENMLVVGRPAENIVTVWRWMDNKLFLPVVRR